VFSYALAMFNYDFDVFNYAAKSLVTVRFIKKHGITIMNDIQLHPSIKLLLK
jgi:hypothetical protein